MEMFKRQLEEKYNQINKEIHQEHILFEKKILELDTVFQQLRNKLDETLANKENLLISSIGQKKVRSKIRLGIDKENKNVKQEICEPEQKNDSVPYSKPKRAASKAAATMINKQINTDNKTKLRQPTENDLIVIKQEVNNEIEANDVSMMPPPTEPIRKIRRHVKKEPVDLSESDSENTRVTRSKFRKPKQDDKKEKSEPVRNSRRKQKEKISDVIIQETNVSIISLSDSEVDESEPKTNEANSRTSETKSSLKNEKSKIKAEKKKKEFRNKRNKRGETSEEDEESGDEKNGQSETEIEETVQNAESRSIEVAINEKANMSNDSTTRPSKRSKGNRDDTRASKRSKSSTEMPTTLLRIDEIKLETSTYEDARQSIPGNVTVTIHEIDNDISNETITITKNINKLLGDTMTIRNKSLEDIGSANCTVVIEKCNMVPRSTADDLLTDDEDPKSTSNKNTPEALPIIADNITNDDSPPPLQPTPKKKTKTKPVFSPYANSPIKKRVAAFEKLNTEVQATTGRITRTKTRLLQEEGDKEDNKAKDKAATPSEKQKPFQVKALSEQKSRMKPTWFNSSSSTENSWKSAVKLSRAEKLQEQVNRLNREDALSKKEAIMKAKIEETRRIREEKMMSAQKKREAREREKEEKIRQQIAEKEEKTQEEMQRKRAIAAQRLAEIEERREQVRLAKLREQEIIEEQRRQRELEEKRQRELQQRRMQELEQKRLREQQKFQELKKAVVEKNRQQAQLPKLPTLDDEDTDEESDRSRPCVNLPSWGQMPELFLTLEAMDKIPRSVTESWFNISPITVDLQLIFHNIDKRLLRRNSSAVWRTPPRYSQLPKF